MADLLLDSIKRAHRLRARLRALTPEQREIVKRELGDEIANEWFLIAREAQLPPPDDGWTIWLFMAGRGSGKTHAASNLIHMAVEAGVKDIGLIGPNAGHLDAVNLDGASGLMKTCIGPPPVLTAYKRKLTFANGATVSLFSGEEPDSLRGPQFELVVVDELARMRYQQDVFDNANLCLRLGDHPRMVITTTPEPTKLMRKLYQMHLEGEGVVLTTGETFDNEKNLPQRFLERLRSVYKNTRVWAQEVRGQLLLDPIDALWRSEWIIRDPVDERLIEQVTVGVDPSGGADVVGIVVSALLTDGRFAILADRSVEGSPGTWGDAVVRAHDDYDADDVCVEINFGGTMCTDVVKSAAKRAFEKGARNSDVIRVKEVTASRGKVLRAEPVSLLWEQGRVLMRPGMEALELEMLQFSREWDRAIHGSPNRLDAMVWSVARLSRVVTNIPIA
jgi:phage terminase large subunit-like protein